MEDEAVGARDALPVEVQPKDFRSFVNFFKGYMGVMPLVTASFAPLVTLSNAIPTYSLQTKELSMMSGLLGFLLVASAFSSRHALATQFFYSKTYQSVRAPTHSKSFRVALFSATPFLLILFTLMFFFVYRWTLERSIMLAQIDQLHRQGTVALDVGWDDPAGVIVSTPDKMIPLRSEILKQVNYRIPYGTELEVLYLGIFAFAELAFVFMALKEYMQSLLKISDENIIGERKRRQVLNDRV